jgi:hypothetical protein
MWRFVTNGSYGVISGKSGLLKGTGLTFVRVESLEDDSATLFFFQIFRSHIFAESPAGDSARTVNHELIF